MIPLAYFHKMRDYFDGDTKKTWDWFKTPNPILGGVTPIEMIKIGRGEKLKKVIDNALDKDKRFSI